MSNLPLHTQNPLERFSDRATDYAKYRPSYPIDAIDAILNRIENRAHSVVADIGAGTGISSRLIADRGVQVWAIEPNSTMREAALAHTLVQFQAGTAEQTGLAAQSVDLVLCCQSFHWFEPIAALTEFARILQPGGSVALMWNDRHRDDDFTNQYTQMIRSVCDPAAFDRLDRKLSDAVALRTNPLFHNYSSHEFINSHRLDRSGLIGIALSASYVPKTGTGYDQLVTQLQALYDRWADADGLITLAYRTHLYFADRIAA